MSYNLDKYKKMSRKESMKIGTLVKQPKGYIAFIPNPFPSKEMVTLSSKTQQLHAKAVLNLGKLDGITQLLPDLDFFILSYIQKEASKSSEIEGTQATMIDLFKSEAQIQQTMPDDIDRITHYVKAMDYGLDRLKKFPLSLRFIRETHDMLIRGTKDEAGKTPGEFRKSQNWIGGGSPNTAKFVPPPVTEMSIALNDLENFMHAEDEYPPLIKAALAHAQFETIHPFLDGNGRTGRLLTTFYLCKLGVLERPVLYLSEFFLNNRRSYYDALNSYHDESGDIEQWLNFFLDGVATIAESAIDTSKKINQLRMQDVTRIHSMGRRAEKAMIVLNQLYKLPIISVKIVEKWTGLSREASNQLVKQFVNVGILEQKDKNVEYGREFWYREYLNLFTTKEEQKS